MAYATPRLSPVAAWRARIFPILLVAFALAYGWRMSGLAPVPPVTDHLSNFYLTGAALTVVTGPSPFRGAVVPLRALVAVAVLATVNLVGEIGVALLDVDDPINRAFGDVNTSDPVDGLFGIAALVLVGALLPRVTEWRARRGHLE